MADGRRKILGGHSAFRDVDGLLELVETIAAETIVVSVFVGTNISFLWYNVIGCVSVVLLATLLQIALPRPRSPQGDSVNRLTP